MAHCDYSSKIIPVIINAYACFIYSGNYSFIQLIFNNCIPKSEVRKMKNDGSKLTPPIGSHKTEGIKWGAEDCKSLKCFLDGLGKFFIPPPVENYLSSLYLCASVLASSNI